MHNSIRNPASTWNIFLIGIKMCTVSIFIRYPNLVSIKKISAANQKKKQFANILTNNASIELKYLCIHARVNAKLNDIISVFMHREWWDQYLLKYHLFESNDSQRQKYTERISSSNYVYFPPNNAQNKQWIDFMKLNIYICCWMSWHRRQQQLQHTSAGGCTQKLHFDISMIWYLLTMSNPCVCWYSFYQFVENWNASIFFGYWKSLNNGLYFFHFWWMFRECGQRISYILRLKPSEEVKTLVTELLIFIPY